MFLACILVCKLIFESDPVAHLPGSKRPSIAIRACPIAYELRDISLARNDSVPKTKLSVFELPYRLVYAVATQDAILIYDTQDPKPLCVFSNLHYATFTDLSWYRSILKLIQPLSSFDRSNDGRALIMASTDGYCSMVSFEDGELGVPLEGESVPECMRKNDLSIATDVNVFSHQDIRKLIALFEDAGRHNPSFNSTICLE